MESTQMSQELMDITEGACLGVVAAMPQEIAPLLRRVGRYRAERVAGFNLYRFEVQGTPVLLIESGMGPGHAKAATEALVSLHRPALLLNYGFAGGVLPGLEVGDIVLAERVLRFEQGALAAAPQPDAGLSALVRDSCHCASVKGGTFITAAAILNKKELAASLEVDMPHPVLEMETAAVLAVAAENGIPFVALRGVSDAAQEELGFSLEELCDSELRISVSRVASCILKKPLILPQLARLARNSRKAGERLACCVGMSLEALTAKL